MQSLRLVSGLWVFVPDAGQCWSGPAVLSCSVAAADIVTVALPAGELRSATVIPFLLASSLVPNARFSARHQSQKRLRHLLRSANVVRIIRISCAAAFWKIRRYTVAAGASCLFCLRTRSRLDRMCERNRAKQTTRFRRVRVPRDFGKYGTSFSTRNAHEA